MRIIRKGTPALLAFLTVAMACSRSDNPAVIGVAPAIADSVALEVVNDNYYDARVYVVYGGGGKHPLGTIRSHTVESDLKFPWQPRHMAFEVHLITGFETYLSHEVDVAPGDYLQLRLPPNFEVSDSFRRISR
jgi:hypothetical protein